MALAEDLRFDLPAFSDDASPLPELQSRLDEATTIEEAIRAYANMALAYNESKRRDRRDKREAVAAFERMADFLNGVGRHLDRFERLVSLEVKTIREDVTAVHRRFDRLEEILKGRKTVPPPPTDSNT